MKWEPVRTWLYGLIGPLVAVLVGYGIVSDTQAALWAALAAAVLTGVGAEVARSKVTPLAKVEAYQPRHAADPIPDTTITAAEGEARVRAAFPDEHYATGGDE